MSQVQLNKSRNIQGKKWASYKKNWILFKIARGKKDRHEQIKIAKKLIKISKGLTLSGKQIPVPNFPDIGVMP